MNSKALFERAQRVIPGGVNSPVRAFKAVGGTPVYIDRARGSRITTAESWELIDFCGSWGPLILGHARQDVIDAVCDAAKKGTSFGTNTPAEVDFAELLCNMVPYMDMVRLVNSGTEAVMTALRLARGFTGRQKILKFDGCYHGHSDCLLVSAGSGLLTGGITSSAGVSPVVAADVLVSPYNDVKAVQHIVERYGKELAAIIVEPVAGNMGLVPSKEDFLDGLRRAANTCGALLIFDEVITGFRLGLTTYGALCSITPDLTCLGKIIGGGMPIGAVGGRKDIMELLAPLGPVYQAGTLSGNPVAIAAGLATLNILQQDPPYERLAQFGEQLGQGLDQIAKKTGVAMHCARFGGMFTPFFTSSPVADLTDAKSCDTSAYAGFFQGMLKKRFYLPPSQFEVGFISAAHTKEDIEAFVSAAEQTLKTLVKT